MADPYRKAQRITPGIPVFSKNSAFIACETAGYVGLVLEGNDVLVYYATVGSYELERYAVIGVTFSNLPGPSAVCTVSVIS